MGLFLYLLLFIFLYCVIKVALKFYGIYRKLHDVTKQFGNFNATQNGRTSYSTGGSNKHTNTRTSTMPTGEVIEDRRTEDEINRKIFTQEEGEYVDFEEEK